MICFEGGISAHCAGTVSSGEGDSFVEKEQLGVAVGGHQFSMPVVVDELADDPKLPAPGCLGEGFVGAMEATPVAHIEPTMGSEFDAGVGGDAILEGH